MCNRAEERRNLHFPVGALTRLATVALLATAVGACGSRAEGKFPTAAEIGEIGNAPPPKRLSVGKVKDVDVWDLVEPPPEPAGQAARAPANPTERLLADAAAKRQGLLWPSEAMNCVAKQAGHFFLAQDALPSDDMTSFLAARCGAVEGDVGFAYLTSTATASVSDDAVFSSNRAATQELIDSHVSNGSQTAGIWAGRAKDKTIVMIAFASRRTRMDRVPVSPNAKSHVVISGELLTPAESLGALSNYGKFGYRRCTVDERVRLPKFSVDCETNADDPATAIEIAAFPPGRVIGRLVVRLIVWPEGRIPQQYARTSLVPKASAAAGADMPATLVGLLNQVRKEAGLAPVTLNAAQSETAVRVAPHYFAAIYGGAPETVADTVVLGMRAGWQVPGLVGEGHFTSALTRNASDPAALLSASLAHPSGRETLLEPSIKVIAIGPVVAKDEGILAGVFSTYSLLDPSATQNEVAKVLSLLNAQRKTRGLPPVTLVESLQGAAAGTAHSIEVGQRDTNDAIEELMQQAAASLKAGVQGWFIGADKLEKITFPPQLLTARSARIAMGIAHYKPKGSPWASYGVLIVTASTPDLVAKTNGNPSRAKIVPSQNFF